MLLSNKNSEQYFNDSVEIANKIFNKIHYMGGYVPHNHSHILYMIRQAMGDSCKTYLEIGVGYGCSMSVSLNSKFACKHIGIDIFDTVQLKTPPKFFVEHIIDATNIYKHEFKLICGDSQSEEIFDSVKNEKVDLLYIDGDHTEEYVYVDFVKYFKIVREGGIIIFDDKVYIHVMNAIIKICNEYSNKIIVYNLDLDYKKFKTLATPYLINSFSTDNVFLNKKFDFKNKLNEELELGNLKKTFSNRNFSFIMQKSSN